MSKKPIFSIIIPTLNEERFISHLLSDLSHQTFKNFEVTLVDAHSKDKTLEKALDFQNRLPYLNLLHSQKQNVSFQRNLGAQHSSGIWLLFFDADNRIPQDFLKNIKIKLKQEPSDFFTTWTAPEKKRSWETIIATFSNLIIEIAHLVEKPAAFGSMIGCKKSVFDQSSGFDEKITFAEDREFTQRLYKNKFRFRIYQKPQYTYSLRRLRKEGTLKILKDQVILQYNILKNGFQIDQQKHYPMKGGSYYLKRKDKNVIDFLELILKEVIKKPQNRAKVKRLITRLRKKHLLTALSKTLKS